MSRRLRRNCALDQIAGRFAPAAAGDGQATIRCRSGVSSSSRCGASKGVFHLCPAPGELPGLRHPGGTDAMGSGQAPADRELRLISGELDQAVKLE